MFPRRHKKIVILSVVIVLALLIIAFTPFNSILEPSFTVHDSVGYSTISGNLSNETRIAYYYGKDVQSTSIIVEQGKPNSTFVLNLTNVAANYEPYDIFLGFDISIYGSLASNLNPSSVILLFRTVISNETGNESQSAFVTVFPIFQRTTNMSIGQSHSLDGFTEYYYPIKLINSPRWNIISGYNISSYHFALRSQGFTNLVLYNGTHILNVTAELNVGGQTAMSSAEVTVIDLGSG